VASARPFVRFEGPHLFLRRADQYNAFASPESSAVGRDKRVLAVNAFEGNKRHVPIGRKLLNGCDKAIVSRLEQRWRGHRMTQVVVEEVAQATGRLELGHVRVQINAVDAPNLERDVLTDNVGDVGRHQNLLAEIPVMVLLTEDTSHVIGPNINGRAAAEYPKVRRRSREPRRTILTKRSMVPRPLSAV
jgi:hypothetical protein